MKDFKDGILFGAVIGVVVLGLCVIIAVEVLGYNIIIVR